MCHHVCLHPLHPSMWGFSETSVILAALDGSASLARALGECWAHSCIFFLTLWGWTGLTSFYKPQTWLWFTARWKSWVSFFISFSSRGSLCSVFISIVAITSCILFTSKFLWTQVSNLNQTKPLILAKKEQMSTLRC